MSSNWPIENIGAPQTKKAITERGNDLVQSMWALRKDNVITVYRTCSEEEASNTFTTMLAGGQLRLDLKQMAPTQEHIVQQVGNNETWAPTGNDPRLALLQSLGFTNQAPVKPREVVEYSYTPTQLGLSGTQIMVQVNVKFTAKGSGLSFEGYGVVVQIGTPLASVTLHPRWPF